MSQVDDLLDILVIFKQVSVEELDLIFRHSSMLAYMGTLRKKGHRIKYVNRIFYYGGQKIPIVC